jgi:deoxycytidylate deaminase
MLSRGDNIWRTEERGHGPQCPSQQPCTIAVHAEQNAIAFAAKYGVELDGSELFVTHQPCLSCAQSIINTGVEFVAYQEPYRLKDGLDLLTSAGIEVMGGLWPETDSVIG